MSAAAATVEAFDEPIEISYAVASPETDMIMRQVISPNSGETIVGY